MPNKEFRIAIIKMLTDIRPIYEQSENFSKEKILKTIKVNKTDEYSN